MEEMTNGTAKDEEDQQWGYEVLYLTFFMYSTSQTKVIIVSTNNFKIICVNMILYTLKC